MTKPLLAMRAATTESFTHLFACEEIPSNSRKPWEQILLHLGEYFESRVNAGQVFKLILDGKPVFQLTEKHRFHSPLLTISILGIATLNWGRKSIAYFFILIMIAALNLLLAHLDRSSYCCEVVTDMACVSQVSSALC